MLSRHGGTVNAAGLWVTAVRGDSCADVGAHVSNGGEFIFFLPRFLTVHIRGLCGENARGKGMHDTYCKTQL